MNLFEPADILIPKVADMEKWAVIACDQFTSNQLYAVLCGQEIPPFQLCPFGFL